MAEKNSTILSKIWLSATNDFQQRIPDPTQHGIDATIDALFDPMNRNYFNQFIDVLVMRIGDTFVHQQSFRNPLAVFKKSRMRYGSTIQEIIPKWIRAHSYVDDAEDVFKIARPDVAQWFHSQNRRDRYDISINRDELRTAFTEEGGLNRLVAAILEVPMNSDEYDEFQIMKQLIAVYEEKWGFFKVQIAALGADSTDAQAKKALKLFRSYGKKLKYPSTLYNSGQLTDVPVFASPNELVLITTPDVMAAIDVDALATLFNLEKGDVQQRIVEIDEFPIDGAQALLTTEDFFMCKDTEYETTSIYNPKTLGQNYFLHHWGVYSVSPFVPAILFTTDNATSVPTVTQTITALDATLTDTTPAPGDIVPITLNLVGTLSSDEGDVPTSIKVAPDAANYSIVITTASNAAIPTSEAIYTYVDEYGNLHVGKNLINGYKIIVTCDSTYINPSGETALYSNSVTATVTE